MYHLGFKKDYSCIPHEKRCAMQAFYSSSILSYYTFSRHCRSWHCQFILWAFQKEEKTKKSRKALNSKSSYLIWESMMQYQKIISQNVQTTWSNIPMEVSKTIAKTGAMKCRSIKSKVVITTWWQLIFTTLALDQLFS